MEEGDLFRARVRKGAIDEKNQADEKKETREKVTFRIVKKERNGILVVVVRSACLILFTPQLVNIRLHVRTFI